MIQFRYVCKRHVTVDEPDAKKALARLLASGHVAEPAARLQRDLGRRQRPATWERPNREQQAA